MLILTSSETVQEREAVLLLLLLLLLRAAFVCPHYMCLPFSNKRACEETTSNFLFLYLYRSVCL